MMAKLKKKLKKQKNVNKAIIFKFNDYEKCLLNN